MRLVLALAALLALAGCSPARLLNAFVPTRGFELHAGLPYGGHPRQRLDVYVPRFEGAQKLPVVVFFYGGSWKGGERATYLFVAEALASRGFVVVVPDYRVYPEVRYPAFMHDAARAVAWTRREVGGLGGDPERLVVMGHSAGAHIATMLAYNDRFLRAEGLERTALRGVIGMAGPYDFVPTEPDIREILSGEGAVDLALPARHVRGGEPPTLLVTGDADTTVSPGNQERLAKRLRAVGSEVIERRYESLNHFTLVGRLAAPLRSDALLDEIVEFARRVTAR